MKKRVSASKVMRVVSILGVICLLALQWVWWGNAYRAVEVDFVSKSQDCLIRAVDKAIMYQLDSTSKGIKVVNVYAGEKMPKGKVITSGRVMSSIFDTEYTVEECINFTKQPLTERLIDCRFCTMLKDEFGYVPKHTIKIFRDSLPINPEDKFRYNRVAFGVNQDSIIHQFGYAAYALAVFPSPIELYLRKGALILVISILLVLLIGSILVFQLLNMQRERKFSDFIIDYTRMITHDLRTPVSGIQMIFKMFHKNGTLQEEIQEKYLVEGENLTKKILLNLDNILYMAKSEQMELPVHLLEVNIREFMENTVEMYRMRDYNPKKVVIETHYEPDDFKCRIDVGLMENVMCNLLDNAIKFTPQEALIVINCSNVGNNLVFSIRDNGIGMSAEDQKRIFVLFERGSANKNSQFPGFGIGLHFVERAVKAHGGKVTVQSEVGKGTEFTIRYTS